jgi:hypothetical protein
MLRKCDSGTRYPTQDRDSDHHAVDASPEYLAPVSSTHGAVSVISYVRMLLVLAAAAVFRRMQVEYSDAA